MKDSSTQSAVENIERAIEEPLVRQFVGEVVAPERRMIEGWEDDYDGSWD